MAAPSSQLALGSSSLADMSSRRGQSPGSVARRARSASPDHKSMRSPIAISTGTSPRCSRPSGFGQPASKAPPSARVGDGGGYTSRGRLCTNSEGGTEIPGRRAQPHRTRSPAARAAGAGPCGRLRILFLKPGLNEGAQRLQQLSRPGALGPPLAAVRLFQREFWSPFRVRSRSARTPSAAARRLRMSRNGTSAPADAPAPQASVKDIALARGTLAEGVFASTRDRTVDSASGLASYHLPSYSDEPFTKPS